MPRSTKPAKYVEQTFDLTGTLNRLDYPASLEFLLVPNVAACVLVHAPIGCTSGVLLRWDLRRSTATFWIGAGAFACVRRPKPRERAAQGRDRACVFEPSLRGSTELNIAIEA